MLTWNAERGRWIWSRAGNLLGTQVVRVVDIDIDLGDGTTKRSVTAGAHRAATVRRGLGIDEINPLDPRWPGETVM
jgi:hypothetical protein